MQKTVYWDLTNSNMNKRDVQEGCANGLYRVILSLSFLLLINPIRELTIFSCLLLYLQLFVMPISVPYHCRIMMEICANYL